MSDNVVWRVLPWRTDDAYMNMAIDKTIAESVAAGGPPTVRFYRWAGKGAVSYGLYESIDDFDKAFCENNGISYVRRFTGGRVMYHSPFDLTYAFAAPTALYSNRIELSNYTSRQLMQFLDDIGLSDVCYNGYGCILTKGKKISGSSPHYEKNRKAVMNHGGIYCAIDYASVARIFKVPEMLVQERITSIFDACSKTVQDMPALQELFQKTFLSNLEYKRGELMQHEWARVEKLRQEYAHQDWLLSGTLSMGICSLNWQVHPELTDKLPPELRARLIEKGTE